MSRIALASLGLLAGCAARPHTIRVTIPDLAGIETPVPGLVVNFLPYDRDSIVRALEAKMPPRPETAALDSLFRLFREPFVRYARLSAALTSAQRTRDSLGHDPNPELRRQWTDSVARLATTVAAARRDLDRIRIEVSPAIDQARARVRAWENSAYVGYRGIAKDLAQRQLVNPVADTTDPLGWATITLPTGRWWATARSIDPSDPNREWYWNLRLDRDTVRLDPRTGRNRPRY